MQMLIRRLHFRADPGAVLRGARGGTGRDDGGKIRVKGDMKHLLAQGFAQAAAEVQAAGL
jgi:hypothetical protein